MSLTHFISCEFKINVYSTFLNKLDIFKKNMPFPVFLAVLIGSNTWTRNKKSKGGPL